MSEYLYQVSVIMPVFNVQDYLEEAIDSVIMQTLDFEKNIQLILVNDGSTDKSAEICLRYRDMYPANITYLSKENGGLSSARNFAFEHIKGKYVNFPDSDDKWGKDAFERAISFFETCEDEVDVVAARERIFEAKDCWHALDFKYQQGTRIVDLTDEKNFNCIQVHVNSVFIRSECVKKHRFNEKVKFGEDGLFINPLIFEKMKYGICSESVYYYRKRLAKNSLTQIQHFDKAYYTSSPDLYYNGLIRASLEHFGRVVPYVQNVLAYDIGWRLRGSLPDEIRSDAAAYRAYISFLEKVMEAVDDGFFLRSPVHKKLSVKCDFYRLRHKGRELAEISRFDTVKKSLYTGNVRLCNFNKANHSMCVVTDFEVKEASVEVRGLVSAWLLSSCPGSELSFVLRSDDEIVIPELRRCEDEKDEGIFGSFEKYLCFTAVLKNGKISPEYRNFQLKFALVADGKLSDITVKYTSQLSEKAGENVILSSEGITVN